MKRFSIFFLFIYISSCAIADYIMPLREYRAVWLTTLNGLDWPRTKANSQNDIEKQKKELSDILDQLCAVGINTVMFQTRVRGTVVYPSEIEPWDGCLTGKPGKAPGYDPLAFAVEECHRRGMEIHAWVVAFPVCKVSAMKALGSSALPRRHPELCYRSDEQYIMDPGVPETGDYIAKICDEIAQNYNIDGIHLDYIRYPERGIRFSDQKTFQRYGNGQSLKQWRSENVNSVVRKIRATLRSRKPWLRLSCSPVGKYADLPRQSSQGWNARDAVNQDAIMWLNEGLMDVLFPMMYFDNEHFYPFLLDWKQSAHHGTIAPGLGIYLLHPQEKNWNLLQLQRQMNVLRQAGLGGYAFFRSKFLTDDVKGIYEWTKEFNKLPALTPAATSLDSIPPTRPNAKARIRNFQVHLSWTPSADDSNVDVSYNVYRIEGYRMLPIALKISETSYVYSPSLPAVLHKPFAITAIDAYGNESEPRVVCAEY